jgi:PPK2 family polyphosphate:nucleotide phosphotransferase
LPLINLKRYRVKPGRQVKLKDWDPGDKSASPGGGEEDARELGKLAARLDELQDRLYADHKRKVLLVLQGMDTSGKDGVIRHVFEGVDPLGVRVASFGVPSKEELDRDYLWRVHKVVPGKGEMVIFNRSHYEDVLIVRVHEWIDEKEVKRRFKQINAFEKLLSDTGTVIIKCFLYISKAEQKRRLQARLEDPTKKWKFRLGDLEERKLWDKYLDAYADALGETSTDWAPWYVIPADSKSNRNLLISRILVDTLEGMKLKYPEPEENLDGVVIK